MPLVGFETPAGILGESQIGASFNGDPVVVVQVDQVSQPEVTSERCSLRGDALHQVAIGHYRIDVIVKERKVRGIEARCKMPLGNGHTDPISEPLPERAGGRLDARRVAVFRVTRRFAFPLPEVFQFFERKVISSQVEE